MALVTQSAGGPSFSSLVAPFTGVNNGSARLLKAISAAELATLRDGDMVYVQSVRDFWKWVPTSTAADDTATEITFCVPTVVGAGAGRFERMNIASPDWIGGSAPQTEWCLASTGNNENSGLNLANALLTTGERQRRWGASYSSAATAYHVRYLTDNYNDVFDLTHWATSSPLYCHGSVNDREGVTPPLATGTATTVQTQNTATNTPWAITTASFANWTGLSLKRLRLTSGASINAYSWPTLQDGVTASKSRMSDFILPVASFSVAPFVGPATTDAGPSNGDTFVVENLRAVTSLVFLMNSNQTATLRVVLDSLQCVSVAGNERISLYSDGCFIGTNQCRFAFNIIHNCRMNFLQDTGSKTIVGGVPGSTVNYSLGATSSVDKVTIQGGITNSLSLAGGPVGANATGVPGSWSVGRVGIFDGTAGGTGIVIGTTGITMRTSGGGVPVTCNLYGVTAGPYLLLSNGAIVYYDRNIFALPMPIAASGASAVRLGNNPLNIGQRNACPAFDAGVTNLFTADRNLTLANIIATVAAGGFGNSFVDPITGAGFTF